MNRHRGRRTRGVQNKRWPLEAQEVRNPPGSHAGRVAGHQEGQATFWDFSLGFTTDAGVGHHSKKDPGVASPKRRRIDTRSFKDLPYRLEYQSLLWVHG